LQAGGQETNFTFNPGKFILLKVMTKYVTFLDKIIEFGFALIFFLVPLIFLPFTSELFEFNKIMLLWTLTIFILSSWAVKSILLKRIVFRRTFWDISLVLFLFFQLMSLIFSIDPHTSFWGYYSRFNGGFLSLLTYALLYWAFVSNLNQKQAKRVLSSAFLSALLISFYAILEHFGRSISCLIVSHEFNTDCWIQDVRARVFATLGQPNWLASFLIGLIPFTWLGTTKNHFQKKIIFTLLFTFFYLALLFTGSRSGLMGFTLSLAIFWPIFFFNHRKKIKEKFLPSFSFMAVPLILITLIFGTPWTPGWWNKKSEKIETSPIQSQLISLQGGTESGEIRKIVWQGATDLWQKYPLLGTGPETFAYSYYWTRPREHNDTSEWDFLYNKAHNEFLNYAATTGTVGLITYLGLIITFIYFGFKKRKRAICLAGLSGFAALSVSHFFGFSVVVSNLFFFLIPAFCLTITQKENLSRKIPRERLAGGQIAFLGLTAALSLYSLVSLVAFWQADILFASGNQLHHKGRHQEARQTLEQALILREEPVYLDALSQTLASLTLETVNQNEEGAQELASQAVFLSDQAIAISPFQLNFWKNRIKILYSFAKLDSQFTQSTIDTLKQAQKLAPTDAKISYNLGLIYLQTQQFDQAVQILKETTQLKPDYTLAHYALSLALEKEGQQEEARKQLEFIINKIDPHYEPAQLKLKAF